MQKQAVVKNKPFRSRGGLCLRLHKSGTALLFLYERETRMNDDLFQMRMLGKVPLESLGKKGNGCK